MVFFSKGSMLQGMHFFRYFTIVLSIGGKKCHSKALVKTHKIHGVFYKQKQQGVPAVGYIE